MKSAESILMHKGLRSTPCRRKVLNIFLSTPKALSQVDLEHAINGEFDRVTLYRTLTTFTENGILHQIPNNSGAAQFALCEGNCSEHTHQDEHVHFKCLTCQRLQCIPDIAIPRFTLPKTYRVLQANLIIEGYCPDCIPKPIPKSL